MKVLFVHDCSSVCHDLAPSLNKLGVETEFLRLKPTLQMTKEIRRSNADIIHANYIGSPALAAFLSGKKYVLHAHGDDLRYGVKPTLKLPVRRAKMIFCSTRDLLPKAKNTVLLPRPVSEIFRPVQITDGKKALYFRKLESDPRTISGEEDYLRWLTRYSSYAGFDLTLKSNSDVPYEMMPKFLSQFSLFFDIPFPEYSKMGLEAMSLGLKVLPVKDDHGENHDPRVIARELLEYYRAILKIPNSQGVLQK